MVLKNFAIWYDSGSGEYFYNYYLPGKIVRKRADGVTVETVHSSALDDY